MAQPAWVVRARRAQMQRQLISTQRLAKREARKATLAIYLEWLRYISQTLLPSRRHLTVAARASIAARSVLENKPLELHIPTAPVIDPSIRALVDRFYDFSPRFAAHIVTISIVITVALFSADVQLRMPLALSRFALPNEQLDDMQVQRQIVGVELFRNDEHALEIVPSANVDVEPMFV